MNQRLLSAIVFSLLVPGCHPNSQSPGRAEGASTPPGNSSTEKLQKEKAFLDSLFTWEMDNVAVLVKVPGKDSLLRVVNEEWPEEIEVTYNILEDAAGNAIMITASPFSESGDWHLVLTHYFDAQGKMFAFSRQMNFFNSGCAEGVAYETRSVYYNHQFKTLKEAYQLVDEKEQPLKPSACDFPYDPPYKVYPERNGYLE